MRTILHRFLLYFPLSIYALVASRIPCHAQHADNDLLVWSRERKLALQDFQYKFDSLRTIADMHSPVSSLLDICYYVKPYTVSDKRLHYEVYAIFHRKISWITDTSLLEHEQGHFDLCEVYARKMKQHLFSLTHDPVKPAGLDEALLQIYDEHEEQQEQYDRETNNGRFINMQLLWHDRIAARLDSLSSPVFNNARGSVILK
jgi:hypothetical protein